MFSKFVFINKYLYANRSALPNENFTVFTYCRDDRESYCFFNLCLAVLLLTVLNILLYLK